MSSVAGIFTLINEKRSAIVSGEFFDVGPQINNGLHSYFDDTTRFYLSLDQSTTCTGIHIRDVEGSVYVLLDFMRNSTDKELYKVQLKKFVSLLIYKLRLNLIVVEKPLFKRGSNATKVLFDLKHYIDSWKYDIPEFYNVPMVDIFPQQWKAKVLDKSKGTHRYNVKREIATDICDKVPALRKYFVCCPATDYDSFDAVGILLGFLAQNYDSAGNKINYGSAVYNYKMHVFPKYIPITEIHNIPLIMQGLPSKQKPVLLKYNAEHSFFDNLRMLCSTYDVGYFVIDNPDIILDMYWETGESFIKGNCFVCVVARQGYFTQKQLDKAKQMNHYFYLE